MARVNFLHFNLLCTSKNVEFSNKCVVPEYLSKMVLPKESINMLLRRS